MAAVSYTTILMISFHANKRLDSCHTTLCLLPRNNKRFAQWQIRCFRIRRPRVSFLAWRASQASSSFSIPFRASSHCFHCSNAPHLFWHNVWPSLDVCRLLRTTPPTTAPSCTWQALLISPPALQAVSMLPKTALWYFQKHTVGLMLYFFRTLRQGCSTHLVSLFSQQLEMKTQM